MKIGRECEECVISQAVRVGEILGLDAAQKEAIVALAKEHVKRFDYTLTPPQNAYRLYEEIALFLNTKDIYKEIKRASTKKAKEFLPECEELLKNSKEPLLCAAKIAVAGNVMDLASKISYDLKDELKNITRLKFEIDDFSLLKTALESAREVVYICDNAGEEIFDKLFIRTIKELYPLTNIYYLTRGKPIINDITYEEALESGLDECAKVLDSGVPTPGFVYEMARAESQERFKSADVIIAKGMGNFECMSEDKYGNIFYLFKVKCEPVGAFAGAPLGAIVCKNG
ncbi:MAG: ARMT1-like domain-containing protein [Campylobacteraceae bacterium]|jgi:uncharacterized protein with ATP-grasp and redox domains|nr:ARMT1-like domain-containing protein [Campylobacteraceae bacterium]